jgi:uncharacterized protein
VVLATRQEPKCRMLEFQTHNSIRDVAREEWNALLGPDPEPFLLWDFLEAFEATGCVHPDVGWAPVPLTVRENGVLVGALPAYVKGNSEGEFVFDHGWARFAYEELRYEYYPKLIVACPFTPATGRRVIVRDSASDQVAQALMSGVRRVSEKLGLSSAHVLFPRRAELELWHRSGFATRSGIQYHWANAGYDSFDDFLARYNSKRRNQVRRERKELQAQGLTLKVYAGPDITPAILDTMYSFYCGTVDKYHWGRQYLNRDFFQEIGSRMRDSIVIVFAHEQASGHAVAGAFNLVGQGRMFGRYWGCTKDYKYLHFNVCYYAGIEECIRRKLQIFEPGAGGEHKVVRGFEPTQTYSAHVFNHTTLDRAVRSFLRRETNVVEESLNDMPDLFVR